MAMAVYMVVKNERFASELCFRHATNNLFIRTVHDTPASGIQLRTLHLFKTLASMRGRMVQTSHSHRGVCLKSRRWQD